MRRDLPFDIDVGGMDKLATALGATKNQMRLAYSRALKRTLSKVTTASIKLMKDRVGIRDSKRVKQRVLAFSHQRENPRELGGLKLFFGLNALRLSEIRGRASGRGGRHHDYRDPQTGRFAARPRRRKSDIPQFRPEGGAMPSSLSFGEDSHIGRTRKGRRSIFIRDGLRAKEAEADIYVPTIDAIEDDIFANIPDIFMKEYERDLRARVERGIHHDLRGKRRR